MRSLLLLLLGAALFPASTIRAQYAVDWFTIDGGGGASTAGAYALAGTLGQPDAATSSAGAYTLQGGFWSAFAGPAESPPTLRIQWDDASVLLAWPNPSPGFQLQQSPSLSAPDWTDVNTPPDVVAGENQVTQLIVPGARVYRLRKL